MGMKLGFTERQVGHMTYSKFDALYGAYKLNFDIEMKFTAARVGYSDAEKETTLDDAIPF